MKKIVFCITIIIDLLFIILLLIYLPLYLLPYMMINIIIIGIFAKNKLKIDIININKIKSLIKTSKIRKHLLSEEKYLENIDIKTFDGSNGTTHPCIIKLDEPFNNYKYYMVHTPYDNNNTELENPSLCVSNDGVNFKEPKGIKNPLLPISKRDKTKIAKYYNDNFLLYENKKLEVWYRFTEEDKNFNPSRVKNKIYRITTQDGINFTDQELMIDNDDIWYLSSSLVKIDNLYYLYYFDKDLKMYCRISKDLHKWNNPINIKINKFNGNMWHGEVKIVDDIIYLLFLSKDYKLYWCTSNIHNPYEFKECDKLNFYYYDTCNMYGNAHPYKSTFLIDNQYIHLYIPYSVNTVKLLKLQKHRKWTMTYTKLRFESFKKLVKEDNNEQ